MYVWVPSDAFFCFQWAKQDLLSLKLPAAMIRREAFKKEKTENLVQVKQQK